MNAHPDNVSVGPAVFIQGLGARLLSSSLLRGPGSSLHVAERSWTAAQHRCGGRPLALRFWRRGCTAAGRCDPQTMAVDALSPSPPASSAARLLLQSGRKRSQGGSSKAPQELLLWWWRRRGDSP